MDSKQALKDLSFLAIGDENHTKKCKEVIEKDLEALEILKKHVYYDNENHVIRMKPFRKSVFNFDYEEVKEWIEKWWREK